MDDGTGRYAVEVLLVEDDQGDVVMITEAFEQSGAPFVILGPIGITVFRHGLPGFSLGNKFPERMAHQFSCVRKCSALHGAFNVTRQFIRHLELECFHPRDVNVSRHTAAGPATQLRSLPLWSNRSNRRMKTAV